MELSLLGWPDDGPTLRLDFRTFRYAGKFVMSNTGKAVIRLGADADGGATAGGAGGRDAASGAGNERGDGEGDGDGDAIPGPVDPAVFEDDVVAAAAFNEDRTDPGVCWIRYITVRDDRRGSGLGARLAAFVAARANERGYRRLRIAVNNPFAYHALYKAGFVYTGRQTGVAELVLERPGERDRATYQCGLDVYRERELGEPEAAFLAEKEGRGPPETVPPELPAE